MKRLLYIVFALVSFNVSAQDIIQMEKSGGVYKVPCKINGLGLKFIFDTGASDVSISLSEAVFMVKNGYLNESDFRGTETYRIANGDIAEGTKVVLRKVEFGKQTLYNVEASIVHSMDAPLLLGQSVLERLGKFSVDYSNSTLIIGSQGGSNQTSAEKTTTTVTDNFGNVNGYPTVKIGTQIWMTKNLNTSTFRNGELIPQAKTNEEWRKAGENQQPAWCYYDNDPANGAMYGKLYNWYAVADSRGLCPTGWHVPTDAEWTELTDFLGGNSGGKMKTTSGWSESNISSDNSSGFSGLPGGIHLNNGSFRFVGSYGYWWSSTEKDTLEAWNRSLSYNLEKSDWFFNDKSDGLSIRCLND